VDSIWLQLGLVGALVLLNAIFAGSELALVSLREGQLKRLEAQSARGVALARLARDPNRFLATIQIGITLAGFLASASAAVSLAEPLESPLSFLGRAAGPVSIIVVTLILSYVTLVLGELAPKRIAMQRAERWGLIVARPLAWLSRATRPVVWLLSRSSDLVVKVFGGDPAAMGEEVTEEEIKDMIATQESYTALQRNIIDGALEIGDRRLHDVLRPRRDVVALDASVPSKEALDLLAATGHSRAPVVHGGELDDVAGVVHLRDLLGADESRNAGDLAREAHFFPESATVLDALRQMLARRSPLAVVVNEHGGTEGIVTVEDLLEELVGEIYDESDRDVLSVVVEADGALLLPGRFPVHDLPDVGVVVPSGAYATVAGLLLAKLQRLPDHPGDSVDIEGWRFTVVAVEHRAITRVRVSGVDGSVPVPPGQHEQA
jgi:putative hemolysin